jgi:hypothetical protein
MLASSLAMATPSIYNNNGVLDELLQFKKSCQYFSKVVQDGGRVASECQSFTRLLDRTLSEGERLDRQLPHKKHRHRYLGKVHTCTEQNEADNLNEEALAHYRQDIQRLIRMKEQVVEEVRRQKVRARKSYNVVYHERLIHDRAVPLYAQDKIFMKEHKEIYLKNNNPRYLKLFPPKKREDTKRGSNAPAHKQKDERDDLVH